MLLDMFNFLQEGIYSLLSYNAKVWSLEKTLLLMFKSQHHLNLLYPLRVRLIAVKSIHAMYA